MNNKNLFLILFVFLCMAACANNQRKNLEVNEVFTTDIKPNGLKLFSYNVTKSMPQEKNDIDKEVHRKRHHAMDDLRSRVRDDNMPGRMNRSSGISGDRPDRESMTDNQKNEVYYNLESKLASTGYCREGYIEYDSFFGKEQSLIKGECKERATEQDRITFDHEN